MKSKQNGDVLIYELEGQLDFETTQQFKSECDTMIASTDKQQIVFNMEKLRFVGSSGISVFIKALKDFNRKRGTLKMCKLSSEFERMFRALQTTRNPFEIYQDETDAVDAFRNPPKRGRRKRIDN